jgi:C1A family cysteine protease
MKAALAISPVAVAIEADQIAFQGYTGGVITTGCGQSLDHGVLAVGYGTESGQDYFLVKNSWGPSWGVDGYVKIGASASNVCGILSSASYATE